MKPVSDLIFEFSKDGGFTGFYLTVASTRLDGQARADEFAGLIRPYLAEGVTIVASAVQSRFAD